MMPELEELSARLRRSIPDAQLVETALPLCPELRLYLISPSNLQKVYKETEIQRILDNPPYWSCCWASGQAIAYYVLSNKEEFRGKRILDFGSGSGVVAIAAAMAGAEKVIGCDIDDDALKAIQVNASLNGVGVSTCRNLAEVTESVDMLIAADVLYDRENLPLLNTFLSCTPRVLLADSRLKNIDYPPYERISEMVATTLPDLGESDEFKQVRVYRAVKGGAASGIKQETP
jgi:predicted nicotinamide N-methyase